MSPVRIDEGPNGYIPHSAQKIPDIRNGIKKAHIMILTLGDLAEYIVSDIFIVYVDTFTAL